MTDTDTTDTERIINALSPHETRSISAISDLTNLDREIVEQEILELVYSSRVTYDLDGDYRLVRRSVDTDSERMTDGGQFGQKPCEHCERFTSPAVGHSPDCPKRNDNTDTNREANL